MMKTPKQVIKNINWSLLRKQKLCLVSMASDKGRPTAEIEALDGIIAFLDALQDSVVDAGMASEVEVFGGQDG